MTNLQLAEALCGIVELLVSVVRRLPGKLEQLNALDEADRHAVNDALGQYAAAICAGEAPDYIE